MNRENVFKEVASKGNNNQIGATAVTTQHNPFRLCLLVAAVASLWFAVALSRHFSSNASKLVSSYNCLLTRLRTVSQLTPAISFYGKKIPRAIYHIPCSSTFLNPLFSSSLTATLSICPPVASSMAWL